MAAIITIVHTLTAILAIVTVLAHCVAIFWPRKTLATHVDAEGRPIVWRNETEKKDVACVWWEDPQSETVTTTEDAPAPPASNVASFSEAVRPLGTQQAVGHRSVA